MSNLRKVTEVSEVKEAKNGNPYVNLTFEASIEDGVINRAEVRAYFADEALLAQLEPGLKMNVEAIA